MFKSKVLKSNVFNKMVFMLLFSFSCSLSALTLEQLQQQLMTDQLLRGDFSQSKTLQMFDQPLHSNGTFLLSQQQGLVWKQISPFPVTLVLAKDKLAQQFSDQVPEVIEAKDNPMVFYFSHLFLSLFKGDMNTLKVQFKLTLVEVKGHWVLLLKPKSAPLNKVFSKIEIKGDKQIEELNLVELNGDATTITFTNISTQPEQLTEQEKDAFNF